MISIGGQVAHEDAAVAVGSQAGEIIVVEGVIPAQRDIEILESPLVIEISAVAAVGIGGHLLGSDGPQRIDPQPIGVVIVECIDAVEDD